MSEETKKPVMRLKCGAISASIWRKTGANGDWYTADVQRCYKDATDAFCYTNSFSRDEIPVAAKLLDMAFGCIRLANPSSQTRLECERLGKCNAHSLLVSMSPPLDESRS